MYTYFPENILGVKSHCMLCDKNSKETKVGKKN